MVKSFECILYRPEGAVARGKLVEFHAARIDQATLSISLFDTYVESIKYISVILFKQLADCLHRCRFMVVSRHRELSQKDLVDEVELLIFSIESIDSLYLQACPSYRMQTFSRHGSMFYPSKLRSTI